MAAGGSSAPPTGPPRALVVLPDLDGVEVCREIRLFSDAYVVMLTARDDEVDKLIGLSVGADNYMTWFGDDHVVAVHVSKLREKLGDRWHQPWIRTVRGVGYRFDAGR
jgi:DNA-binding response OmpR family regulator